MKFKIEGQYPVLRCFLEQGESVVTSAGNMAWMSDGFDYKVHSGGGLMKSFGRAFSGEGFFQNTYTATKDQQEIAFATTMPGEIKHLHLDGTNAIIAQKNAFLVATAQVNFETVLTKKFSAGLLGGEGFILQKFSGFGDLFLEADGSLVEYNLEANETLLVDQGNVFMFDATVKYEIQTVKGMSNKLFGGEGFFLVKLTGPGKVYLQTLPINVLSTEVNRYNIK